MRYYKITARAADKEWEKEFEDRDARDELVNRLAAGSEEFNQKTSDRFIFLSDLGKRRIEGGIISREPGSVGLSALREILRIVGGIRVGLFLSATQEHCRQKVHTYPVRSEAV